MDKVTVNITVEIKKELVVTLENSLQANFNLISYSILPDTKYLYETDSHFRNLVQKEQIAKRIKNDYINKKIR